MLGHLLPTHGTSHRAVVLLEVRILLSDGDSLIANLTQSDVPLTVALMQVKCGCVDVPLAVEGGVLTLKYGDDALSLTSQEETRLEVQGLK